MLPENKNNVINKYLFIYLSFGTLIAFTCTLVKRARDRSDARLTVVGALGGNYIFKPPMDRYPEMPQNEHVTIRISANLIRYVTLRDLFFLA